MFTGSTECLVSKIHTEASGSGDKQLLWLKSLDEDSRDEGGFVKNNFFFIEELSSAKRY